MNTFRTVLPKSSFPFQLEHTHPLMLVGSCFTEHIGAKLSKAKFQTMLNPFGILYNPLSISHCLERILKKTLYTESELREERGLYFSYDHHGSFSSASKEQTLSAINTQLEAAHAFLQTTQVLFLTFGTSFVYSLKETQQVVANCHKMPDQLFERRRLSHEEIVRVYEVLLTPLLSKNPTLQIVFSVSPIRHTRDGLHENNLSKAELLLAIDTLTKRFPQCHYFPSYELLLDDLRDYRFYTEDMLHPSPTALSYIWDYFSESFFSKQAQVTTTEVEKVLSLLGHRVMHPSSTEHTLHQEKITAELARLADRYPHISFHKELQAPK